MTANGAMYYNQYRGITQPQPQDPPRPESDEERRRRLHRQATEEVKYYKKALKEARERYLEYDTAMQEASQEPQEPDEFPKPLSGGVKTD